MRSFWLLDLNQPPELIGGVALDERYLGPTELGARLPSPGRLLPGEHGPVRCSSRAGSARCGRAAGVGLFWCNQFFYYAAEARPYGILLGFSQPDAGVLGFCHPQGCFWARAPMGAGRGGLWGATGMLLSHVYAPALDHAFLGSGPGAEFLAAAPCRLAVVGCIGFPLIALSDVYSTYFKVSLRQSFPPGPWFQGSPVTSGLVLMLEMFLSDSGGAFGRHLRHLLSDVPWQAAAGGIRCANYKNDRLSVHPN